ncbi:MAG: plasmid pRiA4b ORF-3 family protein [Pseudoxanthomonas suwonensis]|nr:plasmid pRiA4b ORF-3 family protein [Pseudoxanthomonas suwonensis]
MSAHHIHVILRHVSPAVTRDIIVDSSMTLERLHQVLQRVMEWNDSHLHLFARNDGHRNRLLFEPRPPPEYADHFDLMPDSRDTALHAVAELLPTAGARAEYKYDFGDGWMHDLVAVTIGPAPPRRKLPACVGAEGAAPFDDCGGPPGFAEFRVAMLDPGHRRHASMLEWFGGRWDDTPPQVATLNRRLRKLENAWLDEDRGAQLH